MERCRIFLAGCLPEDDPAIFATSGLRRSGRRSLFWMDPRTGGIGFTKDPTGSAQSPQRH